MKHIILLFSFLCTVPCLTTWADNTEGRNDSARYLLMVDVSGNGRNIYIEGIQHEIDTFYIAASRHDDLTTYNFAKSVVGVGDSLSPDFYDYCDLRQMMQSLLDFIQSSDSRYVRAFVLSDFHHADTLRSGMSLNVDSLSEMHQAFNAVCHERDVHVHLLVIPPSTRYGGYSLYEVQKTIGPDFCTIHPVTPDGATSDFLLAQVDSLNQIRGITDGPAPKGSAPTTIVTLVIMCGAIASLCLSTRLRRLPMFEKRA